ncbi:diphthine--ammonia ligase [Pinibacter soli]|uniref:Diphthine--ammonia ligase n=1 Tax=Pinibacter soli TaxID=3044211 RepID=A0ABT6RIV8_9BACT|nr:diphthine--ammonia ligase [Pinibacter soli]MDI3321809.1 diphthine--ammonia ligase [Pinibacter soli]
MLGTSWSGGKDSCFALMQMVQQGYTPKVLINMMNENGKISRSHALPHSLLQQQADAMNLPLLTKPSSWEEYEVHFVNTLLEAKEKYRINAMVFGDIDLQPHRDWEEKVCAKAGLQAFLPLWQKNRKELVLQMLQQGIETMIVSCNNTLGEPFLGKIITTQLVTELEAKGIDACGENGEFHTLVINCPLYSNPLQLPEFSTVMHGDYWFVQWREHN